MTTRHYRHKTGLGVGFSPQPPPRQPPHTARPHGGVEPNRKLGPTPPLHHGSESCTAIVSGILCHLGHARRWLCCVFFPESKRCAQETSIATISHLHRSAVPWLRVLHWRTKRLSIYSGANGRTYHAAQHANNSFLRRLWTYALQSKPILTSQILLKVRCLA